MSSSLPLLQELFAPFTTPEPLVRLHALQEDVGYGQYSQGLTLDVDGRSGLMHGWSQEPAFLQALFPFGRANASGSFYALWNASGSGEPASWPVIVFGDEGGEWVVARNLAELLALSTFDVEPRIDYREVCFFKSEKYHRPSPGIAHYIQWLSTTCGISKVEDPTAIVAAAQRDWQQQWDAWKKPFLDPEGAD